MYVHPAMISAVCALFLFLIGGAWTQLNYRLRKVESDKVEDTEMQKELELITARMKLLKQEFMAESEANKKDHDQIIADLGSMHKILEDVRECMNIMARGKEC